VRHIPTDDGQLWVVGRKAAPEQLRIDDGYSVPVREQEGRQKCPDVSAAAEDENLHFMLLAFFCAIFNAILTTAPVDNIFFVLATFGLLFSNFIFSFLGSRLNATERLLIIG